MSRYAKYKKRPKKPIIEQLFGEPTSQTFTDNGDGTIDFCIRWEPTITEDAEFEIIKPKELPDADPTNILRA